MLWAGAVGGELAGAAAGGGLARGAAVQFSELHETLLRNLGKDAAAAESIAFGLVGLVDLVDASVNRWLSNPTPAITSDPLAEFLTTSIWQVLDGNLRRLEVTIDPSTPLNKLPIS